MPFVSTNRLRPVYVPKELPEHFYTMFVRHQPLRNKRRCLLIRRLNHHRSNLHWHGVMINVLVATLFTLPPLSYATPAKSQNTA